jgi:V/A-type H+-transporting ATPase subunit B
MAVSNQLYAAYSQVEEVRGLASVIGEEELSPGDRQILEFGDAFEHEYLDQGADENRSIEQTLDLAWKVLSILPRSELARVSDELLDAHYGREEQDEESSDQEGGG